MSMRTLVQLFGIRRSGNHTIVNWLKQNSLPDSTDKLVVHYNSVSSPHPKDSWPTDPEELIKYFKVDSLTSNGLVILSYEDEFLERATRLPTVVEAKKLFPDARVLTVMLIRDPFNMLASRMQKLRSLREDEATGAARFLSIPLEKVTEIWRSYAREYLERTQVLGDSTRINFNEWFQNHRYRDELLSSMFGGIQNRDLGIDEVPIFGGGSSFEGSTFDGRGSQMIIMDRWKLFVDDSGYRALFKDSEITELSEQIFGHISGTEILSGSRSTIEGALSVSKERR